MGNEFATTIKHVKPSTGVELANNSKVVVVGNGMVSAHFCNELVKLGINQRHQISVYGEESLPAYNRIQLSSFVDHRNSGSLLLEPTNWYKEQGISLSTNNKVLSIDREKQVVHTQYSGEISYDALILATGSRPFQPPIKGANLPGVFLYRTIDDLQKIITAAEGKKSAAIIGGGLLGLEAAQAVQKLGLSASVVERAKYLMPQQLNLRAASFLQNQIEATGITPYLAKNETTITDAGDKLLLSFDDGVSFETDLVIISAGIVPNSEIADSAGLTVGLRGGVVVNEQLETSDRNIYAIGECALLNGRVYGLAAPGFAMASHVAKRLTGEKTEVFPTPDTSTKLKMLGIDVAIVGDSLQQGRRLEFEDDHHYRMLLLSSENELLGGLGVGSWAEAGRIQSLYKSNHLITKKEQNYFLEHGLLSDEQDVTPISQVPDSRVICNCMNITKGCLMTCIENGATTSEELSEQTGAASVCGSCSPLLSQLCGIPPSDKKPIAVRPLLVISILAMIGLLVGIFLPPPRMADSVESFRYKADQLWRDNKIKQITGYSVTGIFIFGTLLSARKRLRWFRFGHFAKWRFFHAAFGTLSLVTLFLHTGFRFGSNLNYWLMFVFVGLNLVGALAGVVAAIESTGTSGLALTARRARPTLVWAHIVLFWPLPILLVFHILSVYLY